MQYTDHALSVITHQQFICNRKAGNVGKMCRKVALFDIPAARLGSVHKVCGLFVLDSMISGWIGLLWCSG